MAVFFSPKKTIALIKNAASIEKEMRRREPDWFFTEEGHALYKAADTDGKKTAYFYEYLVACTLSNNKVKGSKITEEMRQTCLKKAYVMTVMDNSGLSFSGYPTIIKKESNPIIDWSQHSYSWTADIKKLIGKLHGVNIEKLEDDEVYKIITFNQNDPIYKVERLIVSIFTKEGDVPMDTVPFKFSILSSTDDGMDEIDDEEEEDDE